MSEADPASSGLLSHGQASRVAMVTGARRGIGRATAVRLAEEGLRVVLASRSGPVRPGMGDGDMRAAVEGIRQAGGEALAVRLDLEDRGGIDGALQGIAAEWGPVDILINNALCDQPGGQELVGAMDVDAFARMVLGEVVNTTYLSRCVLQAHPGPVTIVNIGSAAADHVPPAPLGQGGWAFSYAASKAALHRLAPFLQLEYGQKVRAFTVNPGFVHTEALIERFGPVAGAAPASLPAAVIAWLVLQPGADRYLGQYVHVQELAAELEDTGVTS